MPSQGSNCPPHWPPPFQSPLLFEGPTRTLLYMGSFGTRGFWESQMLPTPRNASLAFIQPTCWRAGALQTKGQEAGPLGWHHPVGRIQTHSLFKLRVSEKTCAGSRLGNQGRQETLTVSAKVLRCSFQIAGTCSLCSYLNDFLSVPLLRGF